MHQIRVTKLYFSHSNSIVLYFLYKLLYTKRVEHTTQSRRLFIAEPVEGDNIWFDIILYQQKYQTKLKHNTEPRYPLSQ